MNSKTVTIIGGGFAGTALAIHLMRQHAASARVCDPLRIAIVEKNPGWLFGGKAYGATGENGAIRPELNTNSSFREISLIPEDLYDFIRFLENAKDHIKAGTFAQKYQEITGKPLPPEITDAWLQDLCSRTSADVSPRWFYGLYLQARFKEAVEAAQKAHPDFKIETVAGEAIDVKPGGSEQRQVVVRRTDGSTATIDTTGVVLATGHMPSLPKAFLSGDPAAFEADPNYIGDPIASTQKLAAALKGGNKTVFIAGAGLTAEDTVIMAKEQGFFGQPGNKVMMASRHGYAHLPPDSGKKGAIPFEFSKFKDELKAAVPPGDTEKLIAFMRQKWEAFDGEYSRLAIYNSLQPFIGPIQDFLVSDLGFKREDLERMTEEMKSWLIATFTPAAARNRQVLDGLEKTKKVQRQTAAIKSVKRIKGGKFEIVLDRPNNAWRRHKTIRVDVFVDATGGEEKLSALADHGKLPPLYRSLMQQGFITPFTAGGGTVERGIAVNNNRQAIGKDGQPADWLYAVGVPAAGVAAHQEHYYGTGSLNIVTIRRTLTNVARRLLEATGVWGCTPRAPTMAPPTAHP